MRRRIEWIDTLKGIAIALVVWGHNSGGENDVYHFLYSFHMPLFFIISGLLFSPKPIGRYAARSFRHLMVPYIFFLGCYALYELATAHFSPELLPRHFARNIFYGGYRLAGPAAVFWFAGVLWMAQNLYNLICRIPFHRKAWFLPVLIALSYSSLLISRPWVMCVNVVPLAASYIWLGHLLATNLDSTKIARFTQKPYAAVIAGTAALAAFALLWIFRDELTMNIKCNKLGIPGISYIASVAGTMATAYVAYFIHRIGITRLNGFFNRLGQASMTIMYVHMPVRFYLVLAIWPGDFPVMGLLLGIAIPLALHSALQSMRLTRRLALGHAE